MDFVSGEILTKDGLRKGYIAFEKRKILEIGKGRPLKKPVCKGLIIPSIVNSHTHIGDSFIKQKKIKLPKNVEKLVAPPEGLKHKLLRKASDNDIIKGMEKSIDMMIKNGTKYFCDFRENGILGINQLKTALHLLKIKCLILSRPNSLEYDKKELDLLLKDSNGIALSSISDWDYSELKKVVKDTKDKKKIFALHASEIIRENIDDILDLKPNFLVHMIKASESDLTRVKEMNIPIVICPRANSFFGLRPDYKLLKKVKNDILIGTDNAMINSPIILEEIKYIRSVTKEFSILNLLYIVTYNARKALNLDCDILCPNSKADFIVLNKKSLKPLYVSDW
ncbi:MAG: amidohydrolase family protein [Thermoplasmatales archaeon]|nr:MAG: amidohydrolase family protein [Thermoplasmatales archaeon]